MAQRKTIHIINVPLGLGASRRGTDAGPSAFRVAGLGKAIRSLGFSIVKETDGRMTSMEVVELNPFLDHANISAERAVTLVQSALGRSIL